jgi:hypothetical protein
MGGTPSHPSYYLVSFGNHIVNLKAHIGEMPYELPNDSFGSFEAMRVAAGMMDNIGRPKISQSF